MGAHAKMVILHNCFEGGLREILIYLNHVRGNVDSVESRRAGVKEHGDMELIPSKQIYYMSLNEISAS
jgi:hypothetical protein